VDKEPIMRELAIGDQVDQYRLTDLLARTAMASIFKALDTDTGKPSVLKVPHRQYECDLVFSERFRREEEVARRLDHPSLVRALTPREKSRSYIAMEYVEGTSLRAAQQAAGRLPVARALDIARQLGRAAVYLHAEGVVHRDLKPENVILTAGDRVKILDFGIALIGSERRLTWTGLSTTLGTPDYMAPEQIRGRRGDARTDVYAIGTILYELLTGALPYGASDTRALLAAKTHDVPQSPSYHVPGFDPALEAIILKAIAPAPRDRHASASKLLADLEDPSAVAPLDAATGLPRPSPRARGGRRLARALLMAGVLAGLAALVWATERHRPQVAPDVQGPSPALRSSR
jgi:eukaryotic-like serine/threonine-protein kinase